MMAHLRSYKRLLQEAAPTPLKLNSLSLSTLFLSQTDIGAQEFQRVVFFFNEPARPAPTTILPGLKLSALLIVRLGQPPTRSRPGAPVACRAGVSLQSIKGEASPNCQDRRMNLRRGSNVHQQARSMQTDVGGLGAVQSARTLDGARRLVSVVFSGDGKERSATAGTRRSQE